MEQITKRLRKVGNFYELDGEHIRRVVGEPSLDRRPLQVLWELRESALILSKSAPADDIYDDEPLRRVVGKACAR